MPNVKGLVVKLPKNRRKLFHDHGTDGLSFVEPVEYLKSRFGTPLLCFLMESGSITHIAHGKVGQFAGTNLRKVYMSPIFTLDKPIKIVRILSTATGNLAAKLKNNLESGGLLTAKGLEHVIGALLKLASETREIFLPFTEQVKNIIRGLTPTARSNLAMQKEVVLTALLVSGQGFDRTEVSQWVPDEKPTSFLAGLGKQRLSEQQMILTDFRRFPGFKAMEGDVKSSVIFTSPSETLTVIHADHAPLEMLTGADLIYYNETYKSFIFVQYKALESGDNAGYRPDVQLDKEIWRMDTLLETFGPPDVKQCADFRLHGNPFFLKLCPRLDLTPGDTALTKGMYIPLEYWNLLVSSEQAVGPRGGKVVNFKNVGRYLTNTEFAMLVGKAWVGTGPTQSDIVDTVIRETLESGRAALYAAKEQKTDALKGPD